MVSCLTCTSVKFTKTEEKPKESAMLDYCFDMCFFVFSQTINAYSTTVVQPEKNKKRQNKAQQVNEPVKITTKRPTKFR